MRALVQRVRGITRIDVNAHEEKRQAEFSGPGLVVLLGWAKEDESDDLLKIEDWIMSRVFGLRVFPDKEDRMNNSLDQYKKEIQSPEAGILWVPQFTLAGRLESGFRPSFSRALDPSLARFRFNMFCKRTVEQSPDSLKNIFGSFGADMELQFTNWGPVTLLIDTRFSQ